MSIKTPSFDEAHHSALGPRGSHMGNADKNVIDVRNFCLAIITLTPPQRVFILRHISRKQCVYLKQISLNVLTNKLLALSDKDRRYLNTKIVDIKKLASHTVCFDQKSEIIEKNHLLIKKLCLIASNYFDKVM